MKILMTILIFSLVLSNLDSAGKKGSKRYGGTNEKGKHSKYIGGKK